MAREKNPQPVAVDEQAPGVAAAEAPFVTDGVKLPAEAVPGATTAEELEGHADMHREGVDHDAVMDTDHSAAAPPMPGSVAASTGRIGTISQAFGRLPWLASNEGIRTTGVTLDASAFTADANGDKVVYDGTVIAIDTTTNRGVARATGGANGTATAKGILLRTVNLRESDKDVALLIAGEVIQTRLFDDGAYGAVAASVKTDLPFVQFVDGF